MLGSTWLSTAGLPPIALEKRFTSRPARICQLAAKR